MAFSAQETAKMNFHKYPVQIQSKLVWTEFENADSIISQDLIAVLRLLSLFGTCPIRYEAGKSKKFSFKIFSSTTVVCLVSAVCFACIWILNLADLALKKPIFGMEFSAYYRKFEESISQDVNINASTVKTVLSILTIAHITIPASRLSAILLGWLKCHLLEDFLNNWESFSEEYETTFRLYVKYRSKSGGRRCKSWLFIYARWSLPAAVCACIVSLLHYTSATYPHGYAVVNSVFAVLSMLSLELYEDAKACMLFRSVIQAYKMVTQGVAFSAVEKTVDEGEVKRWRKLITLIRSQCNLMNRYLATRQLTLILEVIVLSTMCLFFALSMNIRDPQILPFAALFSFITSMFVLRMSVKAHKAEKITAAESGLASALSLVNIDKADVAALVELKFTHDIMSNNPIQVKYGSFLVFNCSITLTIFSQVVTYLIVLLQFSQK